MRDFYFLTGMLLGACVGGIFVYKSKMAKKAMCECEKDIVSIAKDAKNKISNQTKEKKAN